MADDTSIWTALADSKRRQIINLLEEKPRTTSDLSEFFDVSRFAIMKHLKVLEQANLVQVKRDGRKRWNILNADLAHFLRTKLTDNDAPYRLVDVLGLLPGHSPIATTTSVPASPVHIKQNILLQASPSQVFDAFTVNTDAWWGCRMVTASRIHLEPYVNGRFYEAFNADGQGVLYATVTYIKQNEELRLSGTLELAEQVANGLFPDNYVHVCLRPHEQATQFTLGHYLVGDVDETMRNRCANFWHNLLNQHFKPFIEEGVLYQQSP